MNLADTKRLLAFLRRVDNRDYDDATVIAWQSVLADIDADDALEAARRHYGTSHDYLKPVHLVEGAREIGNQRADQAVTAHRAVAGLPAGPQLGMRAIFEREGIHLAPGRPGAIGRRIRPPRRPERLADVIPIALASAGHAHPVDDA